jgi:hypothetical protein
MDLLTLDANNQPAKLIENYDSLIWSERFNTISDFQIVTGNVEKFMQQLPEGTRLTLRDTSLVMKVETHQIDRKKRQPQKLTIKGRGFESILDQRISIQSVASLTGASDWVVSAKTPSDVAHFIIYRICVDGLVSVKDIFESSIVQFPTPSDYNTSTGPVKNFVVPRGNLLATALGLLQTEAPLDISTTPDTPAVVQHGIRAVRPAAGATAIGIQIYTGVDRSATVYFDATRELLDDGTYLFSKVGSANAAYGLAPGIAATMYEGASEPSGLARRVTLVDGSTSNVADVAVLQNYMSQALAEASETAIFDGSVNPDLNPYTYGANQDYYLGDVVRIAGDYGLDEFARVTEYIRTEDATGEKAFPTLETIVP